MYRVLIRLLTKIRLSSKHGLIMRHTSSVWIELMLFATLSILLITERKGLCF